MTDIALVILGAVLGVGLSAALFSVTPHPYISRLLKRIQLRAPKRRPAVSAGYWSTRDALELGHIKTEWFTIEGNGRSAWQPGSAIVRLVADETCATPVEFEGAVLDIQREIAERRKLGKGKHFDGEGVAISRWLVDRTAQEERISSIAVGVVNKYSQFLAKLNALESESPWIDNRRIVPRPDDPESFSPFLLSHAGIAATVVTKDNLVVLVRRKPFGPRPGELDCSVVEGLHPTKDADGTDGTSVSIEKAVVRGLDEELGVGLSEVNSLAVLGVGVDREYSQWNWLAKVSLNITMSQLRSRIGQAKDRFEAGGLEVAEFAPEPLWQLLTSNEPMWSSGLASIYYAQVSTFGNRIVDRAISDALNSRESVW